MASFAGSLPDNTTIASEGDPWAVRACAALLRAERRHLAGELHRVPVQLLAAASLRLQLAVADESSCPELSAAVREVEAAMSSLRDLMKRLGSPDVDDGVVDDAVARLDGRRTGAAGSPLSIENAAAVVVGCAAAGPCAS